MADLQTIIEFLYPMQADAVHHSLRLAIDTFKQQYEPQHPDRTLLSSPAAVFLITYADHVQAALHPTLPTLHNFLGTYALPAINTVHLLPFYPSSSDDGFAVIDYYSVLPEYGNWQDIDAFRPDFGLMFDLVLNHVSASSYWFQEYLRGNPDYTDYFIDFDQRADTSQVFRPRTHPLLTPFQTAMGKQYVWTTFSADQIDLNFANPKVLLEVVNVLLFYVRQGATAIRLDAIAYVWKELGTSCINLPQAHAVVKLLRSILEEVAPYVLIITETNIPHNDNILYFGDGSDEAHMVYNFSLPPLLLYSFLKRDITLLTRWAQSLSVPTATTAFFNFTASHDGIGVTPLKGLVPDSDIQELVTYVSDRGGHVNYREVPGAEPQPYEFNIVYLDALGGNTNAFIASQAIALCLRGIPGIYFNSLVGARNWTQGVERLGYNRAINRQKFDVEKLIDHLESDASQQRDVYQAYTQLLQARVGEPLFAPDISQQVLALDSRVFAVVRFNATSRLLALTNITNSVVHADGHALRTWLGKDEGVDIISGVLVPLGDGDTILRPYQVVWLK